MILLVMKIHCSLVQMRKFKLNFAEAAGHHATAAKLIEEEVYEMGASKELSQQLIRVRRVLNV